MKGLEIILGSILPVNTIIEKLEEEIQAYKIDPSEDNMDAVCAIAALLLTRKISGGTVEGAVDMAERMEKFEQRNKLFDTGEN